MTDSNPKYPSDQQRPTRLQVRLELSADPGSRLTRHLEFEGHDGTRVSVPLALEQDGALALTFDTAAAYLSSRDSTRAYAGQALHALGTLVDLGKRSCWDRMFLTNRGGSKALDITHVRVVLTYGGVPYELPSSLAEREIPIVDRAFVGRLERDGELSLDAVAKSTRWAFAGVNSRSPEVLRLVAADLGKSGSDAADNFGRNPKYGNRIENLCSEFASWYYHEAGITVAGQSLRDIVGTQQMHDLFKQAGRLYSYNNSSDKFVKVGGSEEYVPRPGDYLERRGAAGAEHSMIVHSYIPGNPSAIVENEKTARVIVYNGPWPVFLREIHLREKEREGGDDFLVGRV